MGAYTEEMRIKEVFFSERPRVLVLIPYILLIYCVF
jgi:hypothetical protein